MEIRRVSDLVEMVGSGRIDSFAIIRKSPEVLRIRMRRGKFWDELWFQASVFDMATGGGEPLLQDALQTILDVVSPG